MKLTKYLWEDEGSAAANRQRGGRGRQGAGSYGKDASRVLIVTGSTQWKATYFGKAKMV